LSSLTVGNTWVFIGILTLHNAENSILQNETHG